MKKLLFSFVFVGMLAITGQAVNPYNLYSSTVESKNLGNKGDTVPEFQVGHVTIFTDNSDSAVYKNGWIRGDAKEWCLYRDHGNGPLTIKADDGYWIKSIVLTYAEHSDGVLSDKPGPNQSPKEAYKSGATIVVNGTEKKFYVGKKNTETGGYLTFTKFTVTYCARPTSIKLDSMVLSVGDVFQFSPTVEPSNADANYKWATSNKNVVSVDNNGVITANAVGESTITITYDTLSAVSLIEVKERSSDQTYEETFSKCTVEKNHTGTTEIEGDNGSYNWKVTNYQRQLTGTDDQVDDRQGIRIRYEGSIATDGVQEGGVKALSFDWRTANSVNIVNYELNVGDFHYAYNSEALVSSDVYRFARRMEVKKNVAISVKQNAKIGTDGQCYIIVGPIKITPYLLFNRPNRRDTIGVFGSDTYDISEILINNTGAQPVYKVKSNTTDATDTIIGSILYINDMTEPGEMVIEASWEKVTTTLTLCVEKAPPVQLESDTINVDLYAKPFVNKISVPAGTGKITYKSSNMAVAVVTDDGVVTPTGDGTTIITAMIASGTLYGRTKVPYVVNVTHQAEMGAALVETLSQCYETKLYEGRIHVMGDNGLYDWVLARFQRQDEDTILGAQGTRLRYMGSIISNAKQEGGVKELSFDWHITGSDMPVHLKVGVGDSVVEFVSRAIPSTTMMHFVYPFRMAVNSEISVAVPDKDNPAQTYIVVSPLTIIPYLMFTAPYRMDTVDMRFANKYDLREALIDNTEGVGEITYVITSDETGAATISGSVVDVSAVEKSGTIGVEARWMSVTTTMRLWVEAAPETGLKEVQNAECTMHSYKAMKDGQLRIYRGGECYSVLGNILNKNQY